MRYGRVRTFDWLHPRDSQTLSFRGFFVCVKQHKAHPGALWKGQKLQLASSAGFPNVELSWFLRLCKRTQSAPGCAMAGSEHLITFNWVHPRDSQTLSFRGFRLCKRTQSAPGRAMAGSEHSIGFIRGIPKR